MFFQVCLLSIAVSGIAMQEPTNDLENDVKHFSLSIGFVSEIEGSYAGKFIDLINDQKIEIEQIRTRARHDAKAIKSDASLSLEEKYARLVDLRKKQDRELKNVLLEDQSKRIKWLPVYQSIMRQGFADSLVNGRVAALLELSDSERIKVGTTAEKAAKEYEKVILTAQKKAIAKLRESLPDEKRKKLDELLEPMMANNGTFWQVDLDQLETSRPQILGTYYLPDISEKESKESKEESKGQASKGN